MVGELGAALYYSCREREIPGIQHLLAFEQRTGKDPVPAWLQKVATPLILKQWIKELENHPDAVFTNYILNGISNGFRIGFNQVATCISAASNMHSAIENAEVVQEYLKKEVPLGRIVGPIRPGAAPVGTQLSPFGVIPKPSQPGKWQLILNLSSPDNKSVNAGIEPELCSLWYLHLDEVISEVARIGKGALVVRECIPHDPGTSRRQTAIRGSVGRAALLRHPFTLRLVFST